MQEIGEVSLVTGKHSGSAPFSFGQLAQAHEGTWPHPVYRCSKCRWVETHDLSA
jgi:hypothetical protein